MEVKDLKWVYETVLLGPGMEETVKLSFNASRKLILLLVEVIQAGSTIQGNGLLESVGKELVDELLLLREEFLDKSKLKNLSDQLKSLA